MKKEINRDEDVAFFGVLNREDLDFIKKTVDDVESGKEKKMVLRNDNNSDSIEYASEEQMIENLDLWIEGDFPKKGKIDVDGAVKNFGKNFLAGNFTNSRSEMERKMSETEKRDSQRLNLNDSHNLSESNQEILNTIAREF